jgi:hypothetical protein
VAVVRDTHLETSGKVLGLREHLQKRWMSKSTREEIRRGKQANAKSIRVKHSNRNQQHKQKMQKLLNG